MHEKLKGRIWDLESLPHIKMEHILKWDDEEDTTTLDLFSKFWLATNFGVVKPDQNLEPFFRGSFAASEAEQLSSQL